MRKLRVDLYTKTVLTVIAACLLFSAFKSVFSPREATAQGVQPVYVEGGHLTIDRIKSSDKWPVYVEIKSGHVCVDGAVSVSSSQTSPMYVEVVNPW